MRTLQANLIWACMIFVLAGPGVAALGDWDEADGHKMHWPQLPDLTPTGMDVQMYGLPLADDFKCSQTGPITDIHIWGSFMNDRLPPEGPGSLTFNLAIYSDIPQQGGEWSRPGQLLWAQVFWPGQYVVRQVHAGPEDWYDPVTGEWIPANHLQAFQYNFHIEKEPYIQQEGRVYWLWIRESRVVVPGQPQDYAFGWKTSMVDLRWNDDAVFWVDDPIRPPLVPGWNPLKYPEQHPFGLTTCDLAFVINGEGQPTVCEPTPDGKACVPYLCPDTTMACLPTKIRIDYNMDPPEYTILNCECLRPNDCHVAIDPPDAVYCTGGCPNVGEKCELQITENADGTVDYECVCQEAEPKHDLGDAPDSTNTHGFNMTAYPSGGPAGTPARYPTVFVAGSPPHGPLHLQPEAVAWLGDAVTLENEADIGPDQDGMNNLDPPADRPDQDQADDGVQVPLVLPHCKRTTFDYKVTVAPLPLEPPTLYVNVWLDWNRDGDWDDTMQCPGATAPTPAPEWAVQNQVLNLVTSGPHTITTPPFMCWHPQPGVDPRPIWMRITLSEQQWPPVPGTIPAGGEGPPQGYDIGETEDYYFTPEPPPPPELEFGDAPEGALAYPSTCKMGAFPTCVTIGPAGWIEHNNFGAFFGPMVDFEPDGNGGLCPLFNPNSYDKDECFQDGDAGLLMPPSYTITGPVGSEVVTPCTSQTGSLGVACTTAIWGNNVDIDVTNNMPNDTVGYVNVLMDWDKSGAWGGASPCGQCSGGVTAQAPEHVLIDFPVPNGHSGPLSALNPPNFLIGPNLGYVWTRFTITEKKLGKGWTGEGSFEDGESEDYLLHVAGAPKPHDCDWVEGDDHKMHWPQLPDLAPTGMDVDMYWTSLADDFKCSESGLVTDIHFWGSFADDCLPPGGPASVFLRLTFYSDVPAGVDQPFSRPGEPLWTRDFAPCQYTVRKVADDREEGWFDPATGFYAPANHFKAYQYNICIDPDDNAFEQEAGRIYWLEIQHIHGDVDPEYTFGWKTTPFDLHFNDDAVYFTPDAGWLPLRYPQGHELEGETLDLAFVITGEGIPQPDVDYGDAPDPTYPTLAASNGASHVIVPRIFLGNGVDPEPDGQPDVNAVGDDNDIDPLNPPPNFDDEDGVVFNTPLIPGQQATVTVTANAGGALLQVWIDYNGDGSWAQASDVVFKDKLLQQGANVLAFQVPLSATPNIRTYARFRYSTTPGIPYFGPAPNGEVEDYLVKIEEPYEPKPPVKH
ncbi:MAG: hypothetical protein JSU94_07370, partial [Phycisphaerales bacterium]